MLTRLPALAAAALSTLAHLFLFRLQVRPYSRLRIRTTNSFTQYTVLHTRAIHTLKLYLYYVDRVLLFLANLVFVPALCQMLAVRAIECEWMDVRKRCACVRWTTRGNSRILPTRGSFIYSLITYRNVAVLKVERVNLFYVLNQLTSNRVKRI